MPCLIVIHFFVVGGESEGLGLVDIVFEVAEVVLQGSGGGTTYGPAGVLVLMLVAVIVVKPILVVKLGASDIPRL